MEIKIKLPFKYDFDRALERLSGDPVNSVNTLWFDRLFQDAFFANRFSVNI